MLKLISEKGKDRLLLFLLWLLPGLIMAQSTSTDDLVLGVERPGAYLPLLYKKKVGLIANHTSMKGDQHLADFLLEQGVDLRKVFAPEHGFRGNASAGAKIKDGKDEKTGLPVVSLYGKNRKPQPEHLQDIEVLVFDIQDVGTRFYTYISTMSYAMEAAAEQGIKFIVLDRPNPNGYFIDGPILEEQFSSFVGLHPVPVVHGMTVAEYAQMVNGEGWLKDGIKVDLEVIPCLQYDHKTRYELPIPPSPNLPNHKAVSLYPSLCFFEGTPVSVGRGTDYPFQWIGAPWMKFGSTALTPEDRPGAMNPPYEGELCFGFNLQGFAEHYLDGAGEIYLTWLVEAYKEAPDKDNFFRSFFHLLAGTKSLSEQIKAGESPADIRASWQEGLEAYQLKRSKYLLYSDF